MLKLGAPVEAGWEDLLPGVRVRFAPIGIKAVRAARRAVATALRIDVEDIEEAGDALSRELLRRGILEWEGVGSQDGTPLTPQTRVGVFNEAGELVEDDEGEPVTQAAVELFLRDPTAFEAADRVYVRPWSDRELEKNGLAGSPNGTSETPAKATASGSATTAPTAGARPTQKAKPRKPGKAART